MGDEHPTFNVVLTPTELELKQVADPTHDLTQRKAKGRLRPTLKNRVPRQSFLKSRINDRWQEATVLAIEEAGHFWVRYANARLVFLPVYESQLPDTGATGPTEDFITDGIVKVGLIPEDSRFHNAGMLSLPPVKGAFTGIVVKVIEKPAVAGHGLDECSCRRDMQLQQRANAHRKAARKAARGK